ncbi:MAG: hypothetical protein IPN36_02100 [Bacteroidetes bacterium]|nr:hypothetical protein [Bacteroidota bacterium]MBL0096088.1 hypothetical protein [Bacteroidota bacterium]
MYNHKIRKGASIGINRNYRGKKGIELWCSNIQEEINFYENKSPNSEQLKAAIAKFNKVKSYQLSESASVGEVISGKGRVIELYDSTAVATFIRKGIAPWDIPRKGDLIWLDYS